MKTGKGSEQGELSLRPCQGKPGIIWVYLWWSAWVSLGEGKFMGWQRVLWRWYSELHYLALLQLASTSVWENRMGLLFGPLYALREIQITILQYACLFICCECFPIIKYSFFHNTIFHFCSTFLLHDALYPIKPGSYY